MQRPTFKSMQKFLAQIPEISMGGCGIAALALYDLAKKENRKVKIYYLYDIWEEWVADKNLEYKKGNSKTADGANHIVLQFKGEDIYHDCKGVYNPENTGFTEFIHSVTRKHLVNSIIHGSCWNNSFDRSVWLPKINEMMGYNILIGKA